MKLHKSVCSPIATLTLIGSLIGGANAAISTSFDSGLEGWTGSGGITSYFSTGGNAGGFLSLDDNEGTWMSVLAPASYHGDLTSYIGGTIGFDAKNLNGATPNNVSSPPLFGTITIEGTSGLAELTLGGAGNPPADGIWHSFSATLDPGDWDGDLGGALANVTSISVVLESANRVNGIAHAETNGFDNFIIQIPEPSSALLLGLGSLSLVLRRSRR